PPVQMWALPVVMAAGSARLETNLRPANRLISVRRFGTLRMEDVSRYFGTTVAVVICFRALERVVPGEVVRLTVPVERVLVFRTDAR
ncbi:MAG TPA: hypothetical protein VE198_24760, partial [Actinoallomurus sp.]|nr:hypothetical protein [Actinoallomurus sp.]